MADFRWRFNFISACGSNQNQRCIGKDSGRTSNTPTKWFLYVFMDFLAILRWCSPGGTNYWVALFALIAALYSFEISFPNTCFLVPNTSLFIHIIIFLYVFNIWGFFLLRIGSDKMYFASMWYRIMMYIIPFLDRYRNFPVLYEYIVSFRSTTFINISCWFVCVLGDGLDSFGLVEQWPWTLLLIFPFCVSSLSGKYLLTALTLIPGQVS